MTATFRSPKSNRSGSSGPPKPRCSSLFPLGQHGSKPDLDGLAVHVGDDRGVGREHLVRQANVELPSLARSTSPARARMTCSLWDRKRVMVPAGRRTGRPSAGRWATWPQGTGLILLWGGTGQEVGDRRGTEVGGKSVGQDAHPVLVLEDVHGAGGPAAFGIGDLASSLAWTQALRSPSAGSWQDKRRVRSVVARVRMPSAAWRWMKTGVLLALCWSCYEKVDTWFRRQGQPSPGRTGARSRRG